MSPQEMDQLVRRANAAGFDSIADYAAALEKRIGLVPRHDEDDPQPPCPRCKSTSVNCPLTGPGCPYDDESAKAA